MQITRDHSLLQEQIDAGLLTAEEAAFSNNKNLVTRAVGVEDAVVLEPRICTRFSPVIFTSCARTACPTCSATPAGADPSGKYPVAGNGAVTDRSGK